MDGVCERRMQRVETPAQIGYHYIGRVVDRDIMFLSTDGMHNMFLSTDGMPLNLHICSVYFAFHVVYCVLCICFCYDDGGDGVWCVCANGNAT